MALTELVQAIEREATEQVRALLATASAQAERVEADAARRHSDESAHAVHAWEEECRSRSDERRATAQRSARATMLTARAAMLDRVRAALQAELPAHAERVAAALARAAIDCAGMRAGVLRCPPGLVTVASKLVPASLHVLAADIGSGVIIELADGTQIVATLEALADREWPQLAAAIVAMMREETAS
jgi:vacuolar-type H+-ATPase subunit E/Vma4